MDYENSKVAKGGDVLRVGDTVTYHHAFQGYDGGVRCGRILKIDPNDEAPVKFDTKVILDLTHRVK
jgi:hypothetical protein